MVDRKRSLYAVASILIVATVLRNGAAAAEEAPSRLAHRTLLQARPQMNPPIFLAEDVERGYVAPRQAQAGRPANTYTYNPQGRRGLIELDPYAPSSSNAAANGIAADFTPGVRNGPNSAAFQQRNGGSNNGNGPPMRGGNNWGSNRGSGAAGNAAGRVRNNKGDRNSLAVLTGPSINSYTGIRPQPITVTGTASTLSQGIRRRGNARAAAQSLAQAYSSGQADAAAQAVASAATGSTADESSAVAEALAETAAVNPRAASNLLAKSAGYAVNRGQGKRYAETMADAFVFARQKKYVPQLTTAVAEAIATGGAPTRYAYGQAIATAIADGGEGQAAVAEATASAFCAGGSTASAWASAYAVALSQDSRGCLVLNQAKAMAKAQCGNGASEAFSKAEATSLVLGFCGLLDMIPGGVDMGWSGSNSGSNTYGGLVQDEFGWGGK